MQHYLRYLTSRVCGGDVLLHDVIITRLWRRRTSPRRYYHASVEAASYHASVLANVLITRLWRRRTYYASVEATYFSKTLLSRVCCGDVVLHDVIITRLWRWRLITRLLRRRTLLTRKNTRLSTSAVKGWHITLAITERVCVTERACVTNMEGQEGQKHVNFNASTTRI